LFVRPHVEALIYGAFSNRAGLSIKFKFILLIYKHFHFHYYVFLSQLYCFHFSKSIALRKKQNRPN